MISIWIRVLEVRKSDATKGGPVVDHDLSFDASLACFGSLAQRLELVANWALKF